MSCRSSGERHAHLCASAGLGLCLAAIGLALHAASARADAALSLKWEAPPNCPQRGEMEAAVLRWLKSSPDPLDASSVEVDGRVLREGKGFVLELELDSQSGHSRERLRAQRCATFSDLVALKVSLAASPPGGVKRPQPTPPPQTAQAPPRPVTRVAPEIVNKPRTQAPNDAAEISDDDAPAAPPHAELRAVFGPGFGALPGVAAHGSLFAGLAAGRLRAELGATTELPNRLQYRDDASGAEFLLIAGAARMCVTVLGSRLQLPFCLGGELGVVRARAYGLSKPVVATPLWAAAVAGPALNLEVSSKLAAWVEFDAVLALVRVHYSIQTRGPLFSSDRIGGRILAGLTLAL